MGTGAEDEIPTRMTFRRGILSALCIAVPPPRHMAGRLGIEPRFVVLETTVLSLNYLPIMVDTTRFELVTSCLSDKRSYQLS